MGLWPEPGRAGVPE